MKEENKRKEVLKEFGKTMALVFLVISSFLLLKLKFFYFSLTFTLSLFFLLSSYLSPFLLNKIEKFWMKLAKVISFFMTKLILILTFYLAIFPMSIILKILKKDILDLKINKTQKSYWKKVEKNGPSERHYTPY